MLSLTSVRSFFQYCMLTCSSTQIYSLLGRKWILNRFGRHAALLCKASTTCSGVLCVCAASCPLPLSLKLFMLLLELQKTPEVVFAGRLSPTFTLTPLLFQVLGAKFEHELLVDHPFSNTAGSCGNFLSSCAIFIHINAVYYSNDFMTSKKKNNNPARFPTCLPSTLAFFLPHIHHTILNKANLFMKCKRLPVL